MSKVNYIEIRDKKTGKVTTVELGGAGGSTPIVEKVVLVSEDQTQGTLETPITQEEFALLASSENSILKVTLQYADGNITEGFLLKCIMSTVIEQRIPSLAFGVTLVEPASSDGPFIQSIMASVLNYNNTEIITTFIIERAPLGGGGTSDTAYVSDSTLYIEEGTTAGGSSGPVELNGVVVDTLEDDFKLFKTIILEIKLSENEEEHAKFFLNNFNWKVNFEADGEKGYLLPFGDGSQFIAMSETSGIVGTGYVIASIHDGVRFVICNNVLIEISKIQDNVFTALDKILFSSIVRTSNIAVAFDETIYSVYGSTISSIQDYFQSNPRITNTNIMIQLELHFDDNSGIVEYEELKFTLTRSSQ